MCKHSGAIVDVTKSILQLGVRSFLQELLSSGTPVKHLSDTRCTWLAKISAIAVSSRLIAACTTSYAEDG